MTANTEMLDSGEFEEVTQHYYLDGTPLPEPFDTVLTRAQTGDEEAFADMWRRCQRSAYFTISKIIGTDSAEDLTQHTAMKVFQYLPNFKMPEKQDAVEPHFRKWVNTIAQHAAIDEVKRNKRRHDTWLSDMSFESLDTEEHRNPGQQAIGAPEAVLDEIASASIIGKALKQLPKKFREAVYAVDVAGYTNTEYAERSGIDRMTVGSRLSRGRQQLRELVLQGAIDGLDYTPKSDSETDSEEQVA